MADSVPRTAPVGQMGCSKHDPNCSLGLYGAGSLCPPTGATWLPASVFLLSTSVSGYHSSHPTHPDLARALRASPASAGRVLRESSWYTSGCFWFCFGSVDVAVELPKGQENMHDILCGNQTTEAKRPPYAFPIYPNNLSYTLHAPNRASGHLEISTCLIVPCAPCDLDSLHSLRSSLSGGSTVF